MAALDNSNQALEVKLQCLASDFDISNDLKEILKDKDDKIDDL